ncbi:MULTISPECIES: hypothetical protein [Streptomyces]|uniref:Uncharacterized protein n=1 Tax=Streptomyces changanensis TaxID=2964669 RepID=A0ABY5NEC0_9ACTN|nr:MULTISPECIES: hypothetical protein [Streptomyces]UUS34397.1 hypothetical protein NRO40_28625 [Streptomyces changanensis]
MPVDALVDVYPLDERQRDGLTAWAGVAFAPDAYDYVPEVVAE